MKDILIRQIEELMSETDDFLANASNFTSFIFNNIENLNWCGFYFDNGNELILSVFQGKPACIKIQYNSGVCGKSFTSKTSIVVDDVHKFVGHIACDSASNSEMVIPIIYEDKVIGVLDIDSPLFKRFDKELQILLTNFLSIFIRKTDISKVRRYYRD